VPTNSSANELENNVTPTKRLLVALAALASVSLGHCAHAQHATEAPQGETITLDAQGGDYPESFQNPHMVEFYALSVEMLRAARRVDAAAYEERSYAIFRAFAKSLGADPDGMIDHLKAIPREMVGIVHDDPKVLDSYENFLVALRGPR
jgi:hypothetical protein